MEIMEIGKLITIILGATGFWKVLDLGLKYRTEKKLKNAELRNMNATTEKHIIENWVQWSQKLETRLKESEDLNETMRKKINCLERKVSEVVKKNKELNNEIETLKKEKKDAA
jgi:septal ring factor EnvC (AmiA/AmiB activator)